ncbi:anti-sigma factor [Actinoplanes siamensis]|uniref:Regulator of SigK n=1 Tax=Actinoplanes siamensis TaxID=1223317 RepID=A0A919N6W4_9ACTN|nr:anti-sigma factor [Actinoplanes siamensis]GIF05486.1 hypothetical protein Asi03nite_30240 [Actinoplanes siamensis]
MIADIHSLVGAYALDAVDDLERAAFERHLAECESCRAEAAELRETAARLADGAWSVPPPRLRDAVLAEMAETRQLPPETVRTPRLRRSRRFLLTAAAAVVVAAAGAGTAVHVIDDQRVRDQEVAARAASDREAQVRAILAAPDVVLRGQELRDGGRVTVAYSRARDTGVVLLAAGAPARSGQVYQLWTVRSEVPVSEGVLAAGEYSAVRIVRGMSSASVVGVSVEPPGGSARPTDMVAGVKIV